MYEKEQNLWSAEALIKLTSFLSDYTESLESKVWCRRSHYIDAFSGIGTNIDAENQSGSHECESLIAIAEYGQNQPEHVELTRCSPATAVEINRPFSSYTFIEQSLRRNHIFEKIAKEFSGLKIRVIRDSCSTYLRRFTLRTEWKSQRALLFLDPFRMLIDWETLVLLAQTRALEIMLNFPVGAALQRKLPNDAAALTSARRASLDRFFGSSEWFNVVYSSAGELSRANANLSSPSVSALMPRAIRATDPGRRLASWYQQRLATIFGAVSKPYLVRNSNHGQLYYLMFAAHKANSLDIAQAFLDLGQAED